MIDAARDLRKRQRGTIVVENGELINTERFPGEQHVQRLRAPRCAERAEAGSFVHVRCHPMLPMRRPLSIMRAGDDWIEILYKSVGDGLRLLASASPGDSVSLIGPIGTPFRPHADRPNCLLIGGGVGIPPMIFLAETLANATRDWAPLAILGSEIPFPFRIEASRLATPWLDAAANGCMPLLERWGIPSRLASLADYPDTYRGLVTDLADLRLRTLDADSLAATQIFACGPTPMLKAVTRLAAAYNLPCQVSLEEFMACAVGGCAGCAVCIETPAGRTMQRVCVDGPVFDAASVVWT